MNKLKNEAIRRMKLLQLHDEGQFTCVEEFRNSLAVWKSEFYGILYWLDSKELAIVDEFKRKYKNFNVLPYHCYKATTEFGELLYILYVSNEKNEDKMFDEDLKHNIVHCYVANMTEPLFSEFGSAYIKSCNGGIILY